MPVLIILGILAVYAIVKIVGSLQRKAPPMTHDQIESMSKEMVGKSKKECNDILRKYR